MSLYDSFDYMTKLQSNLRHLLLSMFLLSVAMAPARLVLPEEGTFHLPDDYGIWIVLAGVAICNVVVTVPCIWGAFSTKHVPLQLAIGWPIYCALAADDLRNRRLAPFRSHPADSAWTTHWCHFQFTAFLNRGFQG
jgi:hypothetical protein